MQSPSITTTKRVQAHAPTDRQIVLVTGGARGIGLEIARQLAARGFSVLLAARNLEAAREAAGQFGATAVQLDVTSTADLVALGAIVEAIGRLDVLVNNAGTVSDFSQTVLSADLSTVDSAWQTNVIGPWRLIQTLLPWLKRSSNPRIVNVAAASGSHGDTEIGLGVEPADRAAYTITKAALAALTHKLSVETPWARVNAVDPGQTASGPGRAPDGFRSVENGAASVVRAVNLGVDGPTGSFLRDGKPVPW